MLNSTPRLCICHKDALWDNVLFEPRDNESPQQTWVPGRATVPILRQRHRGTLASGEVGLPREDFGVTHHHPRLTARAIGIPQRYRQCRSPPTTEVPHGLTRAYARQMHQFKPTKAVVSQRRLISQGSTPPTVRPPWVIWAAYRAAPFQFRVCARRDRLAGITSRGFCSRPWISLVLEFDVPADKAACAPACPPPLHGFYLRAACHRLSRYRHQGCRAVRLV